MRAYRVLKRGIDFSVASAGLVLLSPLLAGAAVVIRIDDGGPVLFRQTRVGRGGRLFSIYKFRTMHVNHGTATQTKNTSPGVTRVGRVLRRTKVDELPQLVNVLRGEMSLVGPRPCLPETMHEMPGWAHSRFSVRPGLTGWAQVNGNAAIPWEDRWRYDVKYVRQASTWTDTAILLATVRVICLGEENPSRGRR